ncbi:MAG: hypothetical protein ACYTFO_00245, partial [Planctomycetota bacterium]
HYLVLPITSVTVDPQDAETVKIVTDFEDARAEYASRLKLLHAFYSLEADVTRSRWASQEYENLDDAQIFEWQGVANATRPNPELTTDENESTLVEDVIAAREAYLVHLETLETHYRLQSEGNDLEAVLSIQKRFDPIRTYYYLDQAEYPPASLRPTEMIPEADDLYAKGFELYEGGKGWLRTFLSTNYNKQRSSLAYFRELIRRYPNSDKIALAAFHVGEIYKEYFNEDVRAVHWYELAWTWDPHIQLPARFQAATVYDHRLKNPLKALRTYQLVVQHEQFDPSNVLYAQGRIEKLQQELSVAPETDQAPPPPPEIPTDPYESDAAAHDEYSGDEIDAGYYPAAEDSYDSEYEGDYEDEDDYGDYEDSGAPERIGQ